MPRGALRRLLTLPVLSTALAFALILAGALVFFRPYLTRMRPALAGVPATAALVSVAEFTVPPGRRACMSTVAIDAKTSLVELDLKPGPHARHGGPPVKVLLSAPGYHASTTVPGGYPGGAAAMPITPPKHSVIGTVCFANIGRSAVVLEGSNEPRTVSRSSMVVAGQPVVGDVALTFGEREESSLLSQASEVFGHISNLTEGLLPVWLIWIIAVLAAFAIPLGTLAAFYVALREMPGGDGAAV